MKTCSGTADPRSVNVMRARKALHRRMGYTELLGWRDVGYITDEEALPDALHGESVAIVAKLRDLHRPGPGPMMSDGTRPPMCLGEPVGGGWWTQWPCAVANVVYTAAERSAREESSDDLEH